LYEKIKRLADAKGVSMYQISVETGIPYTCLADWKSGRSKPKFDKLVKLAKYFGVDVEYFAD
jgi:repressor LexA